MTYGDQVGRKERPTNATLELSMRRPMSTDQTEADLESAISAAIAQAFPRLRRGDVKHQVEFTIRLGHATITAKGRESWVRRGRADILLTFKDQPLAILELKKPGLSVNDNDGEQGLSYARLLPKMAPFVIVTSGGDVRILETFTGDRWTAETPDEREFAKLLASAAKIAATAREMAISSLMGSDPQVWTAATAAASAAVISDLTVTDDSPLRPFGPLTIARQATLEVGRKLSKGSRLVLVAGPPLVGKTNVLGQLCHAVRANAAGALLIEGNASQVFQIIADLLSDTLDWPIDREQARTWVRHISRTEGPLLILVIDKLDPSDRDDVRMIEQLTSNTFGPALRVVVGLDEDAARRVQVSADGRRESAIGRRSTIVDVDELSEAEFRVALRELQRIDLGIMEGGQHSRELRQPWLLQAMATRLSGITRDAIGVFPAVPGLELLGQARSIFSDPELRRRFRDIAIAVAEDAQDQSRPYLLALQLTSRYFVRRATLDRVLATTDVDWLLNHGYLMPSIAQGNIPVVTISPPELVASELAYHLANTLGAMVHEDASLAAEWLAGAASNFLFGDLMAAQAICDLGSGNKGVPFALIDELIKLRPAREAVQAGQQLMTWVDGLGAVEIKPQADGTTILTIEGVEHKVEESGVESGSYSNIHSWLILAHLSSRRFAIDVDGEQRRLDPDILLVVGTADFVLRQPRNDIMLDTLPVQDDADGGQLVCSSAGIVEAVTQSILTYLNRSGRQDRGLFLSKVEDIDDIYLFARVGTALRMLARSANSETAEWAQAVLASEVGPKFRAVPTPPL